MSGSEIPTVDGISRGLLVTFPDLPETARTWVAELLMETMAGSPELADELFHLKLEQEVRAGNENAIRATLAAARRGFVL